MHFIKGGNLFILTILHYIKSKLNNCSILFSHKVNIPSSSKMLVDIIKLNSNITLVDSNGEEIIINNPTPEYIDDMFL